MAFGVSCTKAVETLAKRRGVAILTHNVIYKLLDLLKVSCSCVNYSVIECVLTGSRGGGVAMDRGGGSCGRGCSPEDLPPDRGPGS